MLWIVVAVFLASVSLTYLLQPRLAAPVALPLPALPLPPPFDWHRDYGPLWNAGPSAFWLAPEAEDIKPGVWPMPFVVPKTAAQRMREDIDARYGNRIEFGGRSLIHGTHDGTVDCIVMHFSSEQGMREVEISWHE